MEGSEKADMDGGAGRLWLSGRAPALSPGKNQVLNHPRNAIKAARHPPTLHNGSGWSRYHFC